MGEVLSRGAREGWRSRQRQKGDVGARRKRFYIVDIQECSHTYSVRTGVITGKTMWSVVSSRLFTSWIAVLESQTHWLQDTVISHSHFIHNFPIPLNGFRMEETAVCCSMTYFLVDYLIHLSIHWVKNVLYFPCDPGYDEASLALRRSRQNERGFSWVDSWIFEMSVSGKNSGAHFYLIFINHFDGLWFSSTLPK